MAARPSEGRPFNALHSPAELLGILWGNGHARQCYTRHARQTLWLLTPSQLCDTVLVCCRVASWLELQKSKMLKLQGACIVRGGGGGARIAISCAAPVRVGRVKLCLLAGGWGGRRCVCSVSTAPLHWTSSSALVRGGCHAADMWDAGAHLVAVVALWLAVGVQAIKPCACCSHPASCDGRKL